LGATEKVQLVQVVQDGMTPLAKEIKRPGHGKRLHLNLKRRR